jgi:hypothetical protein
VWPDTETLELLAALWNEKTQKNPSRVHKNANIITVKLDLMLIFATEI